MKLLMLDIIKRLTIIFCKIIYYQLFDLNNLNIRANQCSRRTKTASLKKVTSLIAKSAKGNVYYWKPVSIKY